MLFIGILESQRIAQGWSSLSAPATEQIRAEYNPGELGFDPLGLLPTDAAAKAELQTKEINNGRLAMIAIAGFAVQEEGACPLRQPLWWCALTPVSPSL